MGGRHPAEPIERQDDGREDIEDPPVRSPVARHDQGDEEDRDRDPGLGPDRTDGLVEVAGTAGMGEGPAVEERQGKRKDKPAGQPDPAEGGGWQGQDAGLDGVGDHAGDPEHATAKGHVGTGEDRRGAPLLRQGFQVGEIVSDLDLGVRHGRLLASDGAILENYFVM